MPHTYLIAGATGNVGGRAAHQLLKQGHQVIALGRDKAKLQALSSAGAEVQAVSLDDTHTLTTQLTRAKAAFFLIPPEWASQDFIAHREALAQSITQAVEKSGISHVVFLSSQGAHRLDKNGPITGVAHQERRFQALGQRTGQHILNLRPGFFMENLWANLPLIKQADILPAPIGPSIVGPVIATRDIGDYAARRLAALDFSGVTHADLHGPADLSYSEMAHILGQALGVPVTFVQAPEDQALQGMLGAGMSSVLAHLYLEFYRSWNEGVIFGPSQRTPDSTTPTTLAQFARQVLAPAFKHV